MLRKRLRRERHRITKPTGMPTMLRRTVGLAPSRMALQACVAFACYAAFAVWLTWPLARLAASHLPYVTPAGDFDNLYSTWVLSHESRSLVTSPRHFFDGKIYHPTSRAVFYGPAGLGALPYFAPTFLISGNPTLAVNVLLLLCTALTATGLHLVVYAWTRVTAAGAVAALTFLTSRWLLWGFVGVTPHLSALQYFPWIVFLSSAPLSRAPRRLGLLALVVLQCLTDTVYVTLAVLAPLGVLALARLSRPATRRDGLRVVLLLATVVVLVSPVFLGYASVRAQSVSMQRNTLWGVEPPFDLAGLFWRNAQQTGRPTTVAPVALAIIAVGGLLFLLRARTANGPPAAAAALPAPSTGGWRSALLWTIVGTFISFTPSLDWNGRQIPAPQMMLSQVMPSFFEVIRATSRLGVAAFIGLCLLAGLGYAEIVRWLRTHVVAPSRRRVTEAALACLALFLVYSIPPAGARRFAPTYPLQREPRVPARLEAALRSGDGPLLHLPAIPAGSGWPMPTWHARAMYRSISHGRPLLNGYASYWPDGFIERMELAERLPDPRALAELVAKTGVALVWVDLDELPRRERRRWIKPNALARTSGLDLIARQGSHLLFSVRADPSWQQG
jgi:hypothetical protein